MLDPNNLRPKHRRNRTPCDRCGRYPAVRYWAEGETVTRCARCARRETRRA